MVSSEREEGEYVEVSVVMVNAQVEVEEEANSLARRMIYSRTREDSSGFKAVVNEAV